MLRVYDWQGVLQNESEPVAGLEHGLSWRPSGNLIVSTQRFGFEGGGAGKEGRHDVVFFERNGLRHGEFALREVGKAQTDTPGRRWGYKVRELLWNSNSNILAIWIENDHFDLGRSIPVCYRASDSESRLQSSFGQLEITIGKFLFADCSFPSADMYPGI